eukprot:scaffold181388_cov28-Tisochrysis_lutea.AAC.1
MDNESPQPRQCPPSVPRGSPRAYLPLACPVRATCCIAAPQRQGHCGLKRARACWHARGGSMGSVCATLARPAGSHGVALPAWWQLGGLEPTQLLLLHTSEQQRERHQAQGQRSVGQVRQGARRKPESTAGRQWDVSGGWGDGKHGARSPGARTSTSKSVRIGSQTRAA